LWALAKVKDDKVVEPEKEVHYPAIESRW